jgi:spore coat protein H
VKRARTRSATLLAGLTLACTACEMSAGTAPDDDHGSGARGQEQHAAPDPRAERALDLGWREECRWLGVDPAAVAPANEPVELHIDLPGDELEELYQRDPRSDDRIEGTFRLASDGPELRLEPGLRFRGHSARGLPKKSFNIRFPGHIDAFAADRTNLNAMYTDPSQVREHLAMSMFAAAGLPSPRTEHVTLHINGVFEGLYLAVQRVDEWLLADHDLPSGGASLLRDRTRQVTGRNNSLFNDLAPFVSDPDALAEQLLQRVDARGEPDWAALAELVTWVHTPASPEERFSALAEMVDIEALVDWYALHVLIGDVDAFSDDYWLYRPRSADGRWLVLPWDKDLSFGSLYVQGHGGVSNDLFHYEMDLDARAERQNDFFFEALSLPPVQTLLHERLRELMAEPFSAPWFCHELAGVVPTIEETARRTAAQDAFHLHPANHHSASEHHELHVAALLDFVHLRWAFLERLLSSTTAESGTATVAVTAEDVGRSVHFTDGEGWTLARLDVLDVETEGQISVSLAEEPASADVARSWTIDAGDAEVHGHLSLYYRNTVAFDDWYRSSDGEVEPVGGQLDLAVVDIADDGRMVLDSVANPYSNRVTAEVRLAGTTALILEEAT